MRSVFATLALFAALPALAGEPDFSSPVATVRTYLAATKANDVETARRCWVIEDGNASGTLDVVVGMWIASRRLVAATEGKFGADGVKLLGRWNRPTCTDRAIELTLERLAAADVKQRGDIARLAIPWQPGDGDTSPAFLHVKVPLVLRRVGEEWKLDANVYTGSEKSADLFAPNKIWPIWRDEMGVMNELTTAIDKGQVKDVAEFEKELRSRVDALKAKYEK